MATHNAAQSGGVFHGVPVKIRPRVLRPSLLRSQLKDAAVSHQRTGVADRRHPAGLIRQRRTMAMHNAAQSGGVFHEMPVKIRRRALRPTLPHACRQAQHCGRDG